MSQLNAINNGSSHLSRLLEMQNLSSNFNQFRSVYANDADENFAKGMAETSFIETPPTESPAIEPVSDMAEEAVADASATAAESFEVGPLAIIGAAKTIGDMTSSTISNSLSSDYYNTAISNSQAHGVDAIRQTSMVNQANQQSLANAQHGMSIGSWFGSLGAYLGYAFSNTNVASSLNMNTGYSNQGMVNPELYDSVATSYASTEASDNQSVISS